MNPIPDPNKSRDINISQYAGFITAITVLIKRMIMPKRTVFFAPRRFTTDEPKTIVRIVIMDDVVTRSSIFVLDIPLK